MKCSDCIDGTNDTACNLCRQWQQESKWIWYLDNGCRHVRCPECNSSHIVGIYVYKMKKRFCSWCGARMVDGEQLSMFEQGGEAL